MPTGVSPLTFRRACASALAVALAACALPALAFDYYNGAKAALSINGQVVLSQQGGGPNGPGDAGGTVNRGGVNADLRFTTSDATRSQMLAEGFVPEGAGPMGVRFCAPQ